MLLVDLSRMLDFKNCFSGIGLGISGFWAIVKGNAAPRMHRVCSRNCRRLILDAIIENHKY